MCPPNRAFSERPAGRHSEGCTAWSSPAQAQETRCCGPAPGGGRWAIRALEPQVLPGRCHLPTVWGPPAEAVGMFLGVFLKFYKCAHGNNRRRCLRKIK